MPEMSLFGKLLIKAYETHLAEPYRTSHLASKAGIASGHLWRAIHGALIGPALVNKLCDTLGCDDTWREALLNAAGHASPRQQRQAEQFLERLQA